jgi:hypothetical protein
LLFQAAALSTCQYLAAEAYSPLPCDVDINASPTNSANNKSESPKSSKSPSKRNKSQSKVSDPVVVKCVEMGFPQGHVEYAVKELKVENPRPEMVVAWLLDHPEVFKKSPFSKEYTRLIQSRPSHVS